MEAKNKRRCILVNKISGASYEAEIDLNKSFAININRLALQKQGNMRLDFLSQNDLALLQSDVVDSKFPGTIEISAVIGDTEVSLDPYKTLADSWKEALNDEPLPNGQVFKVLINNYARKEITLTGDEREMVINTRIVKDLLEEKKDLRKRLTATTQKNEELSVKNEELSGEIIELKNRLAKKPGPVKSFFRFLFSMILGALIGAVTFAVVFHVNPFTYNREAGDPTTLIGSTSVLPEPAETESSVSTDEIEALKKDNSALTKENTTLKNDYAALTETNKTLTDEKTKIQKKYDELETKYNELETKYNELVDKQQPNPEEPDNTQTDTTSGDGELKVDAALIMDTDKGVEIISEETSGGKKIVYNAVNEFSEGVIVSFASSSNRSSKFSFVVPAGYSTLSFDVGHIMDSGRFNVELKTLIDNVYIEAGQGTISYNESPRHFEVNGLKENQIVTLEFDTNVFWSDEAVKYGITNMVLRQE